MRSQIPLDRRPSEELTADARRRQRSRRVAGDTGFWGPRQRRDFAQSGGLRCAWRAQVTAGVMIAFIVGKSSGSPPCVAGGTYGSRTATRRCYVPMIARVATLAGIGFTVSLLISELAFGAGALQEAAKIGVLGGSTLAAVRRAFVLIRASREPKVR
ncbi:MAG: Na+/H+ antiporter NhaA [Acidimicrobiia bacterium]